MKHIAVEAVRPQPDSLMLTYILTGTIGDIWIPVVAASARTDRLWERTCFEAFVRSPASVAYYEFNFAPSTHWAVYRFGSYRSDKCIATEVDAPRIVVTSSQTGFTLQALLKLDALPHLPAGAGWHVGLAAVIEEVDGRKSYWALAHPAGKPDFHHPDCFAHELAAA